MRVSMIAEILKDHLKTTSSKPSLAKSVKVSSDSSLGEIDCANCAGGDWHSRAAEFCITCVSKTSLFTAFLSRLTILIARGSDPEYADARLLKAQLLIVRHDFAAAGRELAHYTMAEPNNALARRLLTLCRDARSDDMDRLLTIAAVLNEQQAHCTGPPIFTQHSSDRNILLFPELS